MSQTSKKVKNLIQITYRCAPVDMHIDLSEDEPEIKIYMENGHFFSCILFSDIPRETTWASSRKLGELEVILVYYVIDKIDIFWKDINKGIDFLMNLLLDLFPSTNIYLNFSYSPENYKMLFLKFIEDRKSVIEEVQLTDGSCGLDLHREIMEFGKKAKKFELLPAPVPWRYLIEQDRPGYIDPYR